MPRVAVVGAGISGIACATALQEAGITPAVLDRGRAPGGRMASRTMRGGTFDGRVVDIGASYVTVRDPGFADVVQSLQDEGVVRAWTDTFHVAGPDGIRGTRTGPLRFAAPGGTQSIVEALARRAGVEVRSEVDVAHVAAGDDGLLVDASSYDAVALCMPAPQAARLCDLVPVPSAAFEPVIAVTLGFADRTWPVIDGVFVNDDPVITWIADDGRRRGDDAPVLVIHLAPGESARWLDDPPGAVTPALDAVRRILGVTDAPVHAEAHRWTYAKPVCGHADPFWRHARLSLGLAGDAWTADASASPRVESAWLSGHALGRELAGLL